MFKKLFMGLPPLVLILALLFSANILAESRKIMPSPAPQKTKAIGQVFQSEFDITTKQCKIGVKHYTIRGMEEPLKWEFVQLPKNFQNKDYCMGFIGEIVIKVVPLKCSSGRTFMSSNHRLLCLKNSRIIRIDNLFNSINKAKFKKRT